MVKIFSVVLIAFFATSQAAWVPQPKFFDELRLNELNDAAAVGNNAPVVKKPEIWTFESYLEKAHVGFELEITRTAGCLKGSFTGKGTIKTQKDQAVTAQGTFLDGDLVMVLSCKDEGWKAVMTGKKVMGKPMVKGTSRPISTHVFFTADLDAAGTWSWNSDIKLKEDYVTSELSMVDNNKNGVMDISGNGKDNEGDTWKTTGTVDKNNKVHLTNTFPDGKQAVFDGTLDKSGKKMTGYMSSKSMTGTFTVTIPEIWTFESYLEKAHVGFELEITRTVGCLKGGFTGKGTMKTQKDQAVTAQGTFLDGDLIMVLSCKDEGWKLVMTGKKVMGKPMVKGTSRPISSHILYTLTTKGDGKWIWNSDVNFKKDLLTSELSMTDNANGGKDISGNGKDNDGDTWKTIGIVKKNNEVHLTNTFPDGKQAVFDGTLDKSGKKMEGYLHSKSMTGTFTIKM